ncbi:uncharacterized protein EV420DRAFT_1635215 [Desarmillaria tabescens]|uniref:DUF6534 domain-containing protein n=1 Tax=Armillaria tabescens TaxID=1929756 RepID=A0AA39NLU9_ARMTA|nr:uncharacterized protein EV420DRAFT_1635215 [Desarmillaria tabescens]KAK0467945.1 hypothetical protein EV420DRAFT_1635215 [Desarmillaria tabescens]
MTSLDFNQTLGASFIGVVLGSVIYGIFVFTALYLLYKIRFQGQVVLEGVYYGADVRTSRITQFLAVDCYFRSVDTFHLILVSHFLYHYSVAHFGDFEALAVSNWSVAIHIPVGAVASSLVQFFYAFRVYILSGQRSYVIPAIIVSGFPLSQTAIAVVLAVKISKVRYYTRGRESMPYAVSALACEVISDVVITLSMTYYLRKSKTGISSTSKVLRLLIRYTINTGALTTTTAIASVVSWAVAPDQLVDAALYIVMVRLYTCSFLAILNSRDHLRNVLTLDTELDHLSGIHTTVHGNSTQITIHTTSNPVESKYEGPFSTSTV